MLDRIRPMTLVRIAVAAIFFIHGRYRLITGGYLPFGEWLGSIGFPVGVIWAVAVTAIEVLGAPLLAAGRNGMEYSVLLIVLLTAVLLDARRR